MKTNAKHAPRLRLQVGLFSVLQLALMQAWAGPIALSNSPLFLSAAAKANVLMMYGNSNSMDSDPSGKAVGSDHASSKSEVAREAIRNLITNYTGSINMGLLAYQQNKLDIYELNDSFYDLSYDPAHHDASFTGKRNSQTKKFVDTIPTAYGNVNVYFNVNLPYYSPISGEVFTPSEPGFCYAPTACTSPSADHDFRGWHGNACAYTSDEALELQRSLSDPDKYACYKKKTGTGNNGTGLDKKIGNKDYGFTPTDTDIAQSITDFGKQMAWKSVGRAWFNNSSPGKGYLHVPVALLDTTQAAKLNKKLAKTRFVAGELGTDPEIPLQNGGLTPLEGTVKTAQTYFTGATLPKVEGGPAAVPTSYCSRNFLITLTDGLPSVTPAGVKSSDDDANLANLKTAVAALRASTAKAETYMVGFALPYGVDPTQLNQIAEAGGTEAAYMANDKATLDAAFSKIFLDILQKSSAASSVALSSQSVPLGAHVYQAKFNPENWTGQLLDYAIKSDGTLNATPSWDAGKKLSEMDANDRVILTSNPGLTGKKGVAFRWPADPAAPTDTEMSAAQATALSTNSGGVNDGKGSLRLDYLRGSAANEGDSPKFRKRSGLKLGDMVNSAPHYVGAPSANYNAAGYAAFRAANAARSKMIYVGANDGMLHGFDAATGTEKLAYVPTGVFGNLSRLTDPAYTHRYYVDGTPNTGDAFYGSKWRTVLVGSMGAGAKGIFALDVTKPADFSEAKAKTLVNFEFTDAHDSDVGHIAGPVSIVKMNNGKWAALFGNGYNAGGSGEATLFVVDIESGEKIAELSVGAIDGVTPNALATPLAIDDDSDLAVDVVYAGDLAGNMWKFDLSSENPQKWKVAYKLFASGKPITSAPDAGEHPNGGYLVFFGTGKYLESADVTSAPQNSFYGIWDKGATVTGDLLAQTLTDIPDINGIGYRTASKNKINWATHKGWSIALPSAAERVISEPALRGGRVIFTSIIPSGDVCKAGGSSWLNEVDWLTGSLLPEPPFDTNQDGLVNSSDTLAEGREFDTVVSGAAIQKSPTGPDLEIKFFNESSGAISSVTESANSKTARRLSWRQIK